MEFEFSDKDRTLKLHEFDHDGKYLGKRDIFIAANLGPTRRQISGNIQIDDNPTFNDQFLRVEYSDSHGGEWFYNSKKERISLVSNRIVPMPPEEKEGFAIIFKDEEYHQLEDHKGKTVYSINDGQNLTIQELGPIPESYTLDPRPSPLYDFRDGKGWVVNKTREQVQLDSDFKRKRSYWFSKMSTKFEKFNLDNSAPEGLQSSKPVTQDQINELYQFRKTLQDFPDLDGYPYIDLPEAPTWL